MATTAACAPRSTSSPAASGRSARPESTSLGHTWVWSPSAGGELRTADRKLTATVTRNMQLHQLQLRASAGVGIVHTHAVAALDPYDYTMQGAYQYIDASGVFLVDVELLAGSKPVETGRSPPARSSRSTRRRSSAGAVVGAAADGDDKRNVEVMGYLGLRYRL